MAKNRIQLKTIRIAAKSITSLYLQHLYNPIRQMIETVSAQHSYQINIEVNHAHPFWGLCATLYTKLSAYTLYIYINRLLGKPDFLQIKSLSFPI